MARICLFLVPVLMFIGLAQCRPEDISTILAEILSSTPLKIIESTTPTPGLTSKGTTKAGNGSITIGSNGTDDSSNKIEDDDRVIDEGWEFENATYVDSRRILYSKTVGVGKRPYMVYLHLTKESAKAHKYRGWLCGGVIVEKNYVLTSAACVEDADRFYIVSGTIKFIDSFDYKSDDCVCKHRRKVVWKCIPKNYKFDFQDSIKWSSNDIAIVKVDKPFKLGILEKGCQFATDLICYNNISRELEKPGTKAFISGWGSGSNFREGVYRRQTKVHIPENAKCLQEARVCIMDNEQCSKKWAQRFRSIISQYMICTKDVMKRLSEICEKKYANCTDVERRAAIEDNSQQTDLVGTKIFNVDLGRHLRDPDDYTARRSSMQGGFCENDHGGPLIVKYQGKDRVIGVISACKIDPKTHSCHGPFLYTSVFKNRQFISCAINKEVEDNCRRVFRTGITHEEWTVNWDDYKDDDDEKSSKKEDADLEDDSDDKEKLALRQNEKNEDASKKEGNKEVAKKAKKDDSGDDSEETETTTSKKAEKVDAKNKKEEKEEADEKKSVEAETEKPVHKSKARPVKSENSKTEKKEKAKDEKPSKNSSKGDDKKEVFYESSKDENVNDPIE